MNPLTTAIPTMTITPSPSAAANAYARVDQGITGTASGPAGTDFSSTLQRAMEDAVATGHAADAQAVQALSGGGNLTEVVTALSRAELTLQTATTVRDRVLQAYQDVMKMPI